jgi:pimeloyl-ACP methyl ester carboxylesterase
MLTQGLRKWVRRLRLIAVSMVSFAGGYLYRHQYRFLTNPQASNQPRSNDETGLGYLERYHHFSKVMRDPEIEGELRRYRSDYDQSTQTIFVLRPAGRKSEKLFFFFHGMDGDSGDGVVVRDLVKQQNATVIALGGRGRSWVSDAFLADAAQIIKAESKRFPGYYLIGISMGGTQALALAGLLPDDLRWEILGVIGLIPASDLPAIIAKSSNEVVKKTLMESVNGQMSLLRQRSPSELLDQYKPGLSFFIFYDRQDSMLLAGELEKFIERLRTRQHSVATFSAPGEHDFSFRNFDYLEVMKNLGNNLTENRIPLQSSNQTDARCAQNESQQP